MNEILLSNEVIVYLLSETILFVLLFIAFVSTLKLVKKWNFNVFTTEQFTLENHSYLVMTIIFFVMLLKVILLPYFVYTIDNLSDLIPGAMCGAGVIKANKYGNPLLSLKIVILFLSALWLSINSIDLKAKDYPYIKIKSWFFVLIFILLSVEFALDILYFTNIETTNPVSCCSVIFGQTGGVNGLPFGLDISKLLMLFYLLFVLLLLTTLNEMAILSIVVSLLFGFISYYSVVYFFGTYIYELPTHLCPFCMLQDHYYYVGYVLWGFLLLGVFLAIDTAIMQRFFKQPANSLKKVSLLLLSMFVLLCSSYVAVFYFKNGVFL
jgi:hypothetical protein